MSISFMLALRKLLPEQAIALNAMTVCMPQKDKNLSHHHD